MPPARGAGRRACSGRVLRVSPRRGRAGRLPPPGARSPRTRRRSRRSAPRSRPAGHRLPRGSRARRGCPRAAPPRARPGWRAGRARGSSPSPWPLAPLLLPPLPEGLLRDGLQVPDGRPAGEPPGEAGYLAAAGEGPLADPGQPLGPLVELRVGERPGHRLHHGVLGVELLAQGPLVLLVADDLAAQVDEDLGDVDLDGTHLVARPAQRGRVGQRVRAGLADTHELGRQDGADGAWVDGVVRVAAGPLVDGADVQTRRAPDAVEGLAPDLVRQHVRPAVVEQDEVELLWSVPLGDAGPERRVRVHPLCGRGAGEELHKDLEVLPLGHDLLYAHQRDEDGRQRRAHPAVALGLDDGDRPGLGDGEVRPADADLRVQKLLPEVEASGVRQVLRLVGELLGVELPEEELPDLRAVLVYGRHQDVRRVLPGELDDELGEIGLEGVDALRLQVLVELGLVRRYGLDLDDLLGPFVLRDAGDDAVRLAGVGPLAPDSLGGLAEVAAELGVAQALAGRDLEGRGRAGGEGVGRFGLRGHLSSVVASISARWTVPTPACRRLRPPPMCMRQELSPAAQTSASVSRTRLSLSPSIAAEVSAFFTANVPPNPQHCSASPSSTRSIPRTLRKSSSGASPTFSIRREWQA